MSIDRASAVTVNSGRAASHRPPATASRTSVAVDRCAGSSSSPVTRMLWMPRRMTASRPAITATRISGTIGERLAHVKAATVRARTAPVRGLSMIDPIRRA